MDNSDSDFPKVRDYEALVGSISTAWNRVEKTMDDLLYVYMREEADVVNRLVATIGNVSKGDLLEFVCSKRETNANIRDHVRHFIRMFNILRENRNILQHAIPRLHFGDIFLERVIKLSRLGKVQQFEVSISDMHILDDKMFGAITYGQWLWNAAFDIQKKEDATEASKAYTDMIASFDKPPLPNKIKTFQPPEDQRDD